MLTEFLDRASDIVNQDMTFKMRRRMNGHHPSEDIDYETKLHETHQKIAWDIVKDMFCNHREYLLSCHNTKEMSKKHKQLIESISRTVDDEIERTLLLEE